jgi:hypothetical protein
MAYLSSSAPFVGDVALWFPMSNSITEEALVDAGAVACGVPIPFAPLASFIILIGAMLPPIHKIVKAGIKHGPWDVQGCQGIMEDAWLEAVEGIGAGQGT